MRVAGSGRLLGRLTLALCLLALLGHAVTGHAHADALVRAPIQEHVPGDGHHELTADSHAAAGLAGAQFTVVFVVVDVTAPDALRVPDGRVAILGGPQPGTPPPLFLLHRVLLI